MTFYKLILVQLFLSVAICSRDLRNADSPTFWNQMSSWSRSSENSSDVSLKDKVELKVYYETLCPASVDFFVGQLKPAVKRLGEHLDVHLIPYGHAETYSYRGAYSFSCQHGPRECYGNMVHACAIDVLQNVTHAILFNACLMQYTSYQSDYDHFVSILTWCGYTENVHIAEIYKCVHGTRGSNLLKGYGDKTQVLQPSYVPYVILDGSNYYQDAATSHLVETVCKMLSPKPVACLF